MAANYRIDGEEFEPRGAFDAVCGRLRELTEANISLTERLGGIEVANATMLDRIVAAAPEAQLVDTRLELFSGFPTFCDSEYVSLADCEIHRRNKLSGIIK